MIRVTKGEEAGRTVITVDGQISGDYIAIVETCCNQAISTGAPVDLFLRDVSTIDESGRALLRRLAHKAVRLRASGIYNSYLVCELHPTVTEILGSTTSGKYGHGN